MLTKMELNVLVEMIFEDMNKKHPKQKKVKGEKDLRHGPGILASPVCYTGSDELRPEFREEDELQDQSSRKDSESKKS